jgi:hypothetical protein
MSQTTPLMPVLFRKLFLATLALPVGCGSNASNSGPQQLQDGGEASAQPQVEAGGSDAGATIAVGTALAFRFGPPPARIRAGAANALGSCLGFGRRSVAPARGAGCGRVEANAPRWPAS